MSSANIDQALFVTLVRTVRDRSCARLLIESIRTFGGSLSQSPIWLFEVDPLGAPCHSLARSEVDIVSLRVPSTVKGYSYADKVYACAQAEEMAASEFRSLIWIDAACLIINPPLLFSLDPEHDVAVRPVHIRNVGLFFEDHLDAFWAGICKRIGAHDIENTVETFVGGELIRAYFNSHGFATNPARGLLYEWFECFEALVDDAEFQAEACPDQMHQIFLHQAVWSALLEARLGSKGIRLLPPEYNYPYNLHQSVPLGRRASALNDIVCIAYEDRSLDPEQVDDIEIRAPLRAWLADQAALA